MKKFTLKDNGLDPEETVYDLSMLSFSSTQKTFEIQLEIPVFRNDDKNSTENHVLSLFNSH